MASAQVSIEVIYPKRSIILKSDNWRANWVMSGLYKLKQKSRRKSYWSHLYLLSPSNTSGWKNRHRASPTVFIRTMSRLRSIISSSLLDSVLHERHRTWLCKTPPNISLTTVCGSSFSPPPLPPPLFGSICLIASLLPRSNLCSCTQTLLHASIAYRRSSCASSWRPFRKCLAKYCSRLCILTGASTSSSVVKDCWIRFSK